MHCKSTWYAFRNIAALYFDFEHFGTREGRANLFFNVFSGRFADQHAKVAADVVDDRLIELIASNSQRAGIDHTPQRNQTDLSRAAANVNYQRTRGFIYWQAGTDSCGHWFFNEKTSLAPAAKALSLIARRST